MTMIRSTEAPARISQAKKSRGPLSPKPILDRRLLLKSLTRHDMKVTENQLDLFYQSLHRANYPPSLQRHVQSLLLEDGPSDFFEGFPQLPKSFLHFFLNSEREDEYVTLTSTLHYHKTSSRGDTTKLAVQLQDGHIVETVIMRHEHSRVTICVSSQVGCAMGCTFCATGTMGIRGNLTSGEILEQLVHAQWLLNEEQASRVQAVSRDKENVSSVTVPTSKKPIKGANKDFKIRNVVFMGMGEPLNNYTNVVAACHALIDRKTWNLAHKHVTVSTVGVINRMHDLTRDLPQISLALSLHAPNQLLRSKIVPTAKHYPIEGLIDALDNHMMAQNKYKSRHFSPGNVVTNVKRQTRKETRNAEVNSLHNSGEEKEYYKDSDDAMVSKKQNSINAMKKEYQNGAMALKEEEEIRRRRKIAGRKKKAMIEYVMLQGETSSPECAHQLGKLCEERYVVVNLIPYNQTNVKDKLRCPSEEHIAEFQRIVSSYGCFCFIRRTMGSDIAGACGQLVVDESDEVRARWESDGVDVTTSLPDIEDGPFLDGRNVVQSISTSKESASYDYDKDANELVGDRGVKGSDIIVPNTKMSNVPMTSNEKALHSARHISFSADLSSWTTLLAAATAISATVFVTSGTIFLLQRAKSN